MTDDSLKSFARGVLSDPAYRENLRDRARSGKLTAVEARLLVELGRDAEPVKKKEPSFMMRMFETAQPWEIHVVARMAHRMLGHPETPCHLYDVPRDFVEFYRDLFEDYAGGVKVREKGKNGGEKA